MLKLDAIAYAHPGSGLTYRFDMEALPGQITAVTGPSGSGKSTLLDLIAGFLKPTSGRMTLDSLDLVPLAPEARPVSLLFQSETLFEHLTAERNVALGLPRDVPRGEAARRIVDALAEVGLPRIGPQRASTLSGGQKQRVALARTLLRGRPILLLDEPFSALDDDTRVTTRTLVRALTVAHGWHTVLVSHHLDDVAALASRTYRIEGGKLVEA
ncbi:ATP-binding cassette domain-containing protein [Paradevosia shaoguanensis]|uniref:ATP-binding cassette domain-containing protein n=1 Tax=Paradevosia shaoguanensis TaxID=1335043 RepID=A0AA41QRX0_9HYPH|nr:ATP-binding cassette domain-containing protein [Paradevosia shaoguanensis]MCF1744406.1 ATP-binding cassette domain-containing protein [Paradevosia shaoguanensis]MCI0128889.1 ATP-binding cassette domain-containing protein [Paradevosia shaoguanensis]